MIKYIYLMFFAISAIAVGNVFAQSSLPKGSYQRVCQDCKLLNSHLLECLCENGKIFSKAEIDPTECQGKGMEIISEEGILACKINLEDDRLASALSGPVRWGIISIGTLAALIVAGRFKRCWKEHSPLRGILLYALPLTMIYGIISLAYNA